MTTPRLERRRFQFGLRKLLLWMAVVAVYSGVAKLVATPFVLERSTGGFWIVIGVLGVVAFVLRVLTRPCIAWHLTACVGGVIYGAWWRSILDWSSLIRHWAYYDFVIFFTCEVLPGSIGTAWLVFLIVEGTCRFVKWADKVLESKSDEETRRD